jgi:tetratricopeptide (TPR) repeat protein
MAYLRAGERYGGVGEISRRSDYFTKAFALIEHVSERERLAISAGYYRFVTFDTDKAADIDQSHARAYPREGPPHNWLGIHYWDTGELGKAVQEFQEAIRLDPRDPVFYSNLVEAYSRVDRFDEAKAVAEKAFAQKLDAPPMHRRLLHMAYVQGDRAAQEKEIRWHAGKPQEYQSVALQAENAMTLGRRRQANELIRRGVELARRWNLPEVATRLLIQIPRADALTGNCEAARGRARVLIPPDPDARNAGEPATVLAFCGGLEQSQKLVNEVSQRFPNATYWNTVALPDITAASELSRGQPAKAVEILSTALSRRAMVDTYQFDVAAPNTLFSAGAMPRYLRGLAYLRLGKGTEAAADFQKILDHKGACWGMEYLVSYVGLARAAVLAGDTGKAKKAYEDFFVMWKDADPDIPILIEARKEYAALH